METEHNIPYKAELKRKALHLLALIVPLGIALLGKQLALAFLIPLSLLALIGDVLRVRSARFARLIYRFFGFMMRRDELPEVGAPISINGATWVLLSATLLVLVFPVRLAVPAFATFMIADAAAALIGRRLGRIQWGRTSRTVEGSAGFLACGLAVMAFFPAVPYAVGAAGVLCGCLAEVAPRPLNDNLRVPFTIALIMYLLERFALNLDVPLFFAA